MSTPVGELRDGRRRGWFWAHNAIWDTPGISAHAILVYLYLCRCADAGGTCWPSRSAIARACRISIDSVDRAIKLLCELGLLHKELRRSEDGGYTSNLYVLLDPPEPQPNGADPSRTERLPLAADSGYPLAVPSGYPQPQGAATPAAGSGHPGRRERPEGLPREGRPNEHPHPAPPPDEDAARQLAQAYAAATGQPLSLRQAAHIVRRYGLSYALEKLELVRWRQMNGGFERGPKAYFLAALDGDYRLDPHVPERLRREEEERRRREEEEARRRAERELLEAERQLAAAIDAALEHMPADERAQLEAEAERRARERHGREAQAMPPLWRALVQVELRALVRERLAIGPRSEAG